MEIGF
jgi:predicted SpoU family rRNA methylase